MRTGDIGERDFLKSIQHLIGEIDGAKLGFDEDASDIPLTGDKSIVVNVDTFTSKTDWLPGMTEAQVGRKTAIMALSDIVAKGATPVATMLSLCVPKDYDVGASQELIRGYSQYCFKSGIPFIGGDLGSSSEVVLTGVAIGIAAPETIVTRSGTNEGDIIAVTDLFGFTSVAFEILMNNLKTEGDLRDDALGAAYKPKIHYGFVSALAKKGAITASMDSSDGLGITLHTMANSSSLRFVIDDLPVANGVEHFAKNNLLDTKKLVMQGGEEFIIVLTVPVDRWDDALDVAQKQHVALQAIGTTRKGSGVYYESPDGNFEIPPEGYDNFKEWD